MERDTNVINSEEGMVISLPAQETHRVVENQNNQEADDDRNENTENSIQENSLVFTEEEIIQKIVEKRKDIYTYDRTKSLYENESIAKVKIEQLFRESAPYASAYPRIVEYLKTIKLSNVKPPLDKVATFNTTFKVQSKRSLTDGKHYMSIYKTKDYLLNKTISSVDIKNFFHVINNNRPEVLLNEFKDNMSALENIVLGIIGESLSFKKVNLNYNSSYNIKFKNFSIENVLWHYDYYIEYNKTVFVKNPGQENEILFEAVKDDYKFMQIDVASTDARDDSELDVDEVINPLDIYVNGDTSYINQEIIFNKEQLTAISKDITFSEKMFEFINGALLLYPKIIEILPTNIKFDETEFKVFEYLKGIEDASN